MQRMTIERLAADQFADHSTDATAARFVLEERGCLRCDLNFDANAVVHQCLSRSELNSRWCVLVSAREDFDQVAPLVAAPRPSLSPRAGRGRGPREAWEGERPAPRERVSLLPHRREGGRDQQLIFLADRADPALGGPAAAG